MHESADQFALNKLESWKTEIEEMFCVPDMSVSVECYDKLFNIYPIVDCKLVNSHLNDWAANLVVQRNLYYDSCIQMLNICLRQTPLRGHPYLRRLVLQTYLKETGAWRFAKWLRFLLGAMRYG